MLAFIQGIGGTELLIIFFVILLLFGAKRLPELARGAGKSIKEFKKATQEVGDDFRDAMDSADVNKKPTADNRDKQHAPVPSPGTENRTEKPEPAKTPSDQR